MQTDTVGEHARFRLVCFAGAGASAVIFDSWQEVLPQVEVCPFDLPGHGRRADEPLCFDIDSVVGIVAPMIAASRHAPFALFGHSMGAIVAFEVARELSLRYQFHPEVLYVAARRAPHLPNPEEPWYACPTETFFQRWADLVNMPMWIFDNPRRRATLEPILRADCQIVQTYQFTAERLLACPIVAVGGVADKYCSWSQLTAWQQHTTSRCTVKILSGGHSFVTSSRSELLSLLTADLAARGVSSGELSS
jgi:medium-chain acyl-[acyl-carrier-protein] hydrolase